MLPKFLKALWGDLTAEELKKFGFLSTSIMLILGNYWMIRTTKNGLFNMFVGYKQWQPVAKIFSLVAMIFLVLIYSKLIDIFQKHNLIYIFCLLYSISFFFLGYAIKYPSIVTLKQTSIFYPLVSWIPGKAIGWFSFILIESYGSLVVALFYSFLASVMTTELAKKGYGMMTFIIEIGTIGGSLFTLYFVEKIGIPTLYVIGSGIVLLAPISIFFYVKKYPHEDEMAKPIKMIPGKPRALKTSKTYSRIKPPTGFFEGLKQILNKPYVMGIFVVAATFEVISIITEYQMNYIATDIYTSAESLSAFTGYQSVGTNLLALIFAFAGTSFFMRNFGLKFCLTAFPITLGIIVLTVFSIHHSGVTDYYLMWSLLAAMIAIKGFNYALNKPSMEILYIPTSKDIKFKAKGWIDVFGNRSTKGIGATINQRLSQSFPTLFLYGTIISLSIIGGWILVAIFVSKKFVHLQQENQIVE